MNMEFHQIGNSNAGRFELFLPVSGETIADFSEVPEIILGYVGLEPIAVEQSLQTKLDQIETATVRRFRDLLLTFPPISLLEFDGSWEVRFCCSRNPADFSSGVNFFLPAGHHNIQAELAKFADSYDVQSPELFEFFTHFYGLSSASFWHGFSSTLSPFSFLELEIDEDWEDAVILFSEGNGDMLLMNEEQEVGWWYHESNEIGYFADSFAECLEKYIDFKMKYLDHFGSYTSYSPKKPREPPIAG